MEFLRGSAISVDTSDEDWWGKQTSSTKEILNYVETEEQSYNVVLDYSVGRQIDGNEINEILGSESNDVGSSEKNPKNIQQQSNATEVIVQTWNRRNKNQVAEDC